MRFKMGCSQSLILPFEGSEMRKNDVLLIVHQEGHRKSSGSANQGADILQMHLDARNCVMINLKDMNQLVEYFGGPWTEIAHKKIFQAKKEGPVFVLAYLEELNCALTYANEILGGKILFVLEDPLKSFTGPPVEIIHRTKHVLDHSGRCFVKRLEQFCG